MKKFKILLVSGKVMFVEGSNWKAHEDGDLTVEKDGNYILCISRGQWVYLSDGATK